MDETPNFEENKVQSIALFPIPKVVAFPGSVLPLHVFEPRYREMVNQCIETGQWIGVCHTKKELLAAQKNQKPEDILSSNQASYLPYDVFSAGNCLLKETLEDGRMLIEIEMKSRFQKMKTLSNDPYEIVEAKAFHDHHSAKANDKEEAEAMALKVAQFIEEVLCEQLENADDWVKGLEIQKFSPLKMSYRAFDFLRLDPDYCQLALETRSPLERLKVFWALVQEINHPEETPSFVN